MCNGKASVHRTARLAAAFRRNALLVTSIDRENSVQCSLCVLEGLKQSKGIISAFRRSLALAIGHSIGFRM